MADTLNYIGWCFSPSHSCLWYSLVDIPKKSPMGSSWYKETLHLWMRTLNLMLMIWLNSTGLEEPLKNFVCLFRERGRWLCLCLELINVTFWGWLTRVGCEEKIGDSHAIIKQDIQKVTTQMVITPGDRCKQKFKDRIHRTWLPRAIREDCPPWVT